MARKRKGLEETWEDILREINDWDGCEVYALAPNSHGTNGECWDVIAAFEPRLYEEDSIGVIASGKTPLEAVTKAKERLEKEGATDGTDQASPRDADHQHHA